MKTEEIIELTSQYIIPSYRRIPVAFKEGRGIRLWDMEGKEYLDLIAGLAVNSLGYGHPKLIQTINEQAKLLIHTSNLFHIQPQVELAEKLSKLSLGGKVFFCNSGAEANEAAIKLTRRFGSQNGRYEIITMTGSFHGRTLTTIAATAQRKYQQGFEPLPEGFKYAVFNDLDSVKDLVAPTTCAIMTEVIQGEGGVNVGREDFIVGLRQVCDQYNLLLIMDEVQTGMARTGRMFVYEHYGITPDIITLAKGLAGGIPIGAMVAKRKISELLGPGTHASTFGGNFLSSRAALATLEVILGEDLIEKAQRLGNYLMERLTGLKGRYSFIKEVRGKGLMVGLELEIPGEKIVEKCFRRGLLINCTVEKVLRFLPPLTISKEEIDEAIQILDQAFREVKEE
ncbi:TPA: aspartate aminotransferase family protein [bacterium]|nr:aspartate aminotransferase family protein [bacterium]